MEVKLKIPRSEQADAFANELNYEIEMLPNATYIHTNLFDRDDAPRIFHIPNGISQFGFKLFISEQEMYDPHTETATIICGTNGERLKSYNYSIGKGEASFCVRDQLIRISGWKDEQGEIKFRIEKIKAFLISKGTAVSWKKIFLFSNQSKEYKEDCFVDAIQALKGKFTNAMSVYADIPKPKQIEKKKREGHQSMKHPFFERMKNMFRKSQIPGRVVKI